MLKTYKQCQNDEVYHVIKESTIQTLLNYVLHRFQPGGFVTAVLVNDLMESIGRADKENRETLPAICTYIYNELPANCWGSYEIVTQWLNCEEQEKRNATT